MKGNIVLNNNTKNELIEKRRKRKKIKMGILLIIMLVALSITLCLTLPYFNVKQILVEDNRNITSEEIIKLSNIKVGNNIFYLNLNESETNIRKNSYISNVDIKRKLPNKIIIHVDERSAFFYIKKGENYLIVDNEGVILEEKATIKGMNLIRLDGLKGEYVVGETIKSDDDRKVDLIKQMSKLIKNLKKGVPEPTLVDITDITDIKMYYGNMVIKLGTSSELDKKYNKALNILMDANLQNKKGYIDVSFNGDPVFFIED